jgi:hypothetical protein
MVQHSIYTTMNVEVYHLGDLDGDVRAFIEDLIERAETHPDWNDFDNYWTSRIGPFYDARGMERKQVPKTAAWKIAQDLSGRIGIAAGLVRKGDYRDELHLLIVNEFKTRREFCERTGISEDMLSHVLARRKHLSLDALTDALARVGRTLRIMPESTPSRQ